MTAKAINSPQLKFSTTLLTAGKTATGIQVPEEIVTALGSSKRPPVKITLNGYTYRSTIAVMGGKFMIGVSAEVREAAYVKGGDKITVSLELDEQPREVDIPAVFEKVLAKDPKAKKKFETLSYSNKRRLIAPIASAKTDGTRERNILKAISELQK
jgi:hypothetical protein